MLQKTEVYILIIVASLVFLLVAFFLIVFVLYFLKKKKQIDLEKELLKKTFSQTLLQSQLEIKEQTLQHISHELHDNLGQIASLIKINLTTLQLNDPAKAAEKIEDTKELTRQLIGDIKTMSVSLGSDRISQIGLAKAIQIEIKRIDKTGEFSASYQEEGNIPVIDNEKAVILYRMVQEILNNMVKHSGAKHINVMLNVSGNLFTLALSDDGVGFNVQEKFNSGGAGLHNLQNRAALINAQLNMKSNPGKGTQTTIQLPL